MVARVLRTIRTNKRYAIIGGAAAACIVALLIFQGGALFDMAGKGGSWMIGKVVRSVAYKDTAPATAAGKQAPRPQAKTAGIPLPAEKVSPEDAPIATVETAPEEPPVALESAQPETPPVTAAPEGAEEVSAPAEEALAQVPAPSIEESFRHRFEPYRSPR